MQQIGIVALLFRWLTPSKTLVGIVRWDQSRTPSFIGERWIGNDVIISAQRFLSVFLAILKFGRSQRVALHDVGRWEVMQDHVHTGKTRSGHVHFLALQRDARACLGSNFKQQRAGAASWVVSSG